MDEVRFAARRIATRMSQSPASATIPILSEWFQSAPVGLLVLDEKLDCVAANAAWLQVARTPDGETLGNSWRAAFTSDTQAALLESLQFHLCARTEAKAFGGRKLSPISVRGSDSGTVLWIQASVLLSDGKECGAILSIVGDFAAEPDEGAEPVPKLAVRGLNRTPGGEVTRLVEILDSTPDFVWDADACGRVNWQNRRLQELRPEDLNSTQSPFFWEVFSEEDNATLEGVAVPHAIEHGNWIGDVDFLDAKGTEWPVSMVLIAHKSDRGAVQGYSAIMRDIRERKRIEVALRESDSQFQKIADKIPGMIYRCIQYPDGTNRYTYVSHHVTDIFEVAPDEVLKDPAALRKRIHEDDLGRYRETLQESFQKQGEYRIELRLQNPSSGTTWISSLAHATALDDGSVVWDGFVVDITAHKEAEKQLQSSNEQLARATRHKDQFLANMSHELRTPLSAILSVAEGIQAGVYRSAEAVSEAAGLVERSGHHLLALINDVLDLAKVESGKMTLQFESIAVQKLCEASLSFVEQQAIQKGVRLQFNAPWNLPAIDADPMRVRQILINLLSNAVKFTPPGGRVTLHVEHNELSCDAGASQADRMLFSILDTGIGIPKSEMDSLFLPFTQGDCSLDRDNEGTGLGLTLAKQFAELHSGKIAVSSEPSVGSCFTLDLPTKQSAEAWSESQSVGPKATTLNTDSPKPGDAVEPADSVRPSDSVRPGDIPARRGGFEVAVRQSARVNEAAKANESGAAVRVLLADDNEGVAAGLSAFLRACGYHVSLASNGNEAVDLAVRRQPDVILMDVQMPGKDGLTAIREIREFAVLERTPIVALTALAMRDDEKLCLKAGANRYVSKPVKLSELAQIIEDVVGVDKGSR